MKKLYTLFFFFTLCTLSAQEEPPGYRNFPIVISLQFHSLSMPFQNVKSNLHNIGIGLGTELSFGGKDHLLQQLQVIWYRNKVVGNGLLLYTQTAWRPNIVSDFYREVNLGAGYLMARRPVRSFQQEGSTWIPVGRRGKGMLAIPIGIAAGYEKYKTGTYASPFLGYQFLAVTGYNKSIPVLPQTLLQAGMRIHLED